MRDRPPLVQHIDEWGTTVCAQSVLQSPIIVVATAVVIMPRSIKGLHRDSSHSCFIAVAIPTEYCNLPPPPPLPSPSSSALPDSDHSYSDDWEEESEGRSSDEEEQEDPRDYCKGN